MPMITVRLPVPGCTRVFSQAKWPRSVRAWASLSKIATERPPLPSKVLAGVPSSSLAK